MYQNARGRKGPALGCGTVTKLSGGGWRVVLIGVWQRLRGGALEPRRAAASVAVGGFIGCLPIYGLQTPLCALVTLPARLDFALAWTVMLFANPITALPLVLAEIELGSWICDGSRVPLPTLHTSMHELVPYAKFVAVGSVALGAFTGAVGAILTYLIVHRLRRRAAAALAHSTTRTESI